MALLEVAPARMSVILAVPNVIQVQCNYCWRFWPASEVMEIGHGGVLMCFYCHQKHQVAEEAFQPPRVCQGPCGRTFEQISAVTPGNKVGMTIHWKDGVYQVLCASCDADYVLKRQDLYGSTEFGYARGVK